MRKLFVVVVVLCVLGMSASASWGACAWALWIKTELTKSVLDYHHT